MENEKRRFPRVCATHLVYIEQRNEEQELALQTHGRTIDLGLSGMLLECHLPHVRSGPLSLTLAGREQLVECRGHSLRCERLTADRWVIAVELEEPPRNYLRHLSLIFAEAT